MKKICSLLFFISFFFAQVCAAQEESVSASVDKTTLPLGQSLTLELTYHNVKPPKADTSALRDDFDVVGVAESTNISIINSSHSMEYVRRFRLIPKKEGKLVIPAFDDGKGHQTAPLTIEVLPAGSSVPTANNATSSAQPAPQTFSLQGRINDNNPYVQQEIIYTLSLIDSGGLQGREPVFELNDSSAWVIRSLGTPEIKPIVKDGKKMREIIFKYAFFPQKSGRLTLPAARFEGYTLSRPQKRIDPFADLFGDDLSATLGFTFAEQNPVLLRSKPIEVQVKPIPAENQGNWWLPAQDVMLVDKWEPENPGFKVGEAVHRTIYLKVDGVLDNQLPELDFAATPGIKQYPEKPATEMTVDNGTVISLMKLSNVYIPNQSGKTTIPHVAVKWFNVKTGKLETATLPAQNIIVSKEAEVEENIAPQADLTKQNADIVATEATAPQADIPVNTKSAETDTKAVLIIAVGAFVLGIGMTLLFMRKSISSPEVKNLKSWHKEVILCAKNKDFRGLKNALLQWGAENFAMTKLNSFNELKNLVKDKAFSDELDKINALLYTENNVAWDAKLFCNIFEQISHKNKPTPRKDKLLPELY